MSNKWGAVQILFRGAFSHACFTPILCGQGFARRYTRSKYTQNAGQYVKNIKNQAAQNIGEMVEIAANRRWGKNKKKKHEHDAKYGFYKYRTRFAIKNGSNVYEIYNSTIVIRNSEDGKKYLYDIIKIKRDNDVRLAATSYEARYGEAVYPSSNDIISNNASIPNSENNVNSQNAQTKEKFSLKETDWHTVMTEEESSEYNRKNINPNDGSQGTGGTGTDEFRH